jgi:hypothetical protein
VFGQCLAAILSLGMVLPAGVHAQGLMAVVPAPAVTTGLSDPYHPAVLNAVTVHPDNPFLFDFLVSTGDSHLSGAALQDESARLVRYFFTAMTVPEQDFWVNLSPYESGKILPDPLGLTEMGRDMLAQDYGLKQLAASLTDPNDPLGRRFWDGIYQGAKQRFGTSELPVNVFSKIWIMPDEASVFQQGNRAFVRGCHLKVRLAEDVAAAALSAGNEVSEDLKRSLKQDSGAQEALSAQVMRAVIVPAIEREVNEGRQFAPLRQIFYSVVLAAWFKKNLSRGLIGQVYADKNKMAGIDLGGPQATSAIYQQYMGAFRKGAYNFIREETDDLSGELIPRKYFAGGIGVGASSSSRLQVMPLQPKDHAMAADLVRGTAFNVQAALSDAAQAARRQPLLVKMRSGRYITAQKSNFADKLLAIRQARDVSPLLRASGTEFRLKKLDEFPDLFHRVQEKLRNAGEMEAASMLHNVDIIPSDTGNGSLSDDQWVVYYDKNSGKIQVYIVVDQQLMDDALTTRVMDAVLEATFYYKEEKGSLTSSEARKRADYVFRLIAVLDRIHIAFEQVKSRYIEFQQKVEQENSPLDRVSGEAFVEFRKILQYLNGLDPDIRERLTAGLRSAMATDSRTDAQARAVPLLTGMLETLQLLGLMRAFAWHPKIWDDGLSHEVELFSQNFFRIAPEILTQDFDAMVRQLTDNAVRRLENQRALAALSHVSPDKDTVFSVVEMALISIALGVDAAPLLRETENFPVHIRRMFQLLFGVDPQERFGIYHPGADGALPVVSFGKEASGPFRLNKIMMLDHPELQDISHDDLLASIDHHVPGKELMQSRQWVSVLYEVIGATAMKVGLMYLGLGIPLPDREKVFVGVEALRRSGLSVDVRKEFFVPVSGSERFRPVDGFVEKLTDRMTEGGLNEKQVEILFGLWRQAYNDYPAAMVLMGALATYRDDTNNAAANKMTVYDRFLMQAMESMMDTPSGRLYWLFATERFRYNRQNPMLSDGDRKWDWEMPFRGNTRRFGATEIVVDGSVFQPDGQMADWGWYGQVRRLIRDRLEFADGLFSVTSIVGKSMALDGASGVGKTVIVFSDRMLADDDGHLLKLSVLNMMNDSALRLARLFLKDAHFQNLRAHYAGLAGEMVRVNFDSSDRMSTVTLAGLTVNGTVTPYTGSPLERKVYTQLLLQSIRRGPPLAQWTGRYYSIDHLGLQEPEKSDPRFTLATNYLFVLSARDGARHTHRVAEIIRDEEGQKTGFLTTDERGARHRFIVAAEIPTTDSDGNTDTRLLFEESRTVETQVMPEGLLSDGALRGMARTNGVDQFIEDVLLSLEEYRSAADQEEQNSIRHRMSGVIRQVLHSAEGGALLTRDMLKAWAVALNDGGVAVERTPGDALRMIGERAVDADFDRDVSVLLSEINLVGGSTALKRIVSLFNRFKALRPFAANARWMDRLVLSWMLKKAGFPAFPFGLDPLTNLEFRTVEDIETVIRRAYAEMSGQLPAVDNAETVVTPGGILLDPRHIQWADVSDAVSPATPSKTLADYPQWDIGAFEGFQVNILAVEPAKAAVF